MMELGGQGYVLPQENRDNIAIYIICLYRYFIYCPKISIYSSAACVNGKVSLGSDNPTVYHMIHPLAHMYN